MENFKTRINTSKNLIDFSLKKLDELNIKTVSNSHIISIIIGDTKYQKFQKI